LSKDCEKTHPLKCIFKTNSVLTNLLIYSLQSNRMK